MQIQRAVQLGGPEVRIRAVDYLKGRRRYMMHYEAGKITPGERLEETDMPDEWMAAHHGWNYVNGEDFKRAQADDEGEDSMSEVTDRAEDGDPEHDMVWVTVEDPVDCPEGATASTWRPTVAKAKPSPSAGSGKLGGKDRNPTLRFERDPKCEDECDGAA